MIKMNTHSDIYTHTYTHTRIPSHTGTHSQTHVHKHTPHCSMANGLRVLVIREDFVVKILAH